MPESIIARCESKGLRLTEQRRTVARVLEESRDHPDVEELHGRALGIDPGISIATVYRTVRLLEELDIVEKHEFRDGRARYEDAEREHHDHLINIQTDEVIEFVDQEIELLQRKVAERLGYKLLGHRMVLYGIPLEDG